MLDRIKADGFQKERRISGVGKTAGRQGDKYWWYFKYYYFDN